MTRVSVRMVVSVTSPPGSAHVQRAGSVQSVNRGVPLDATVSTAWTPATVRTTHPVIM